ncbi:response regulator receiver domain-containing protein [Litorimonas taeanensis]|uniref:Response regulator receiver domain-containing protein n=1 Tax=Litorimonas taeanensis TaxID=568099 RepID=A0A420WDY7_9PROT|nr:response regulator [Litorimonas taeanensis]RKQ69231.1 response regulator receiver domain-containing protein [Litorimonas taeanensis]
MKIFLAEDEAIIALSLQMDLEDMGAEVVGPFLSLEACMKSIDKVKFDAAILDIDLNGREVFPIAKKMAAQNIPFVFHTGRRHAETVSKKFPKAKVFTKPSSPKRMYMALQEMTG